VLTREKLGLILNLQLTTVQDELPLNCQLFADQISIVLCTQHILILKILILQKTFCLLQFLFLAERNTVIGKDYGLYDRCKVINIPKNLLIEVMGN
jgi:hypothetical protein